MKKIPSTLLAGFTLIDSTIIVVILAILAIFAVPRVTSEMERRRAADAFTYLAQVRSAQDGYHSRNGIYSQHLNQLGVSIGKPDNFRVSPLTSLDWNGAWQLRLARQGSNCGYGEYTVVFDQDGFSSIKSSVPAELRP